MAVYFTHIRLVDTKGWNLADGANQKLMRFHEITKTMIKLCAFLLDRGELWSRDLATFLDIPKHGVFKLFGMLGH